MIKMKIVHAINILSSITISISFRTIQNVFVVFPKSVSTLVTMRKKNTDSTTYSAINSRIKRLRSAVLGSDLILFLGIPEINTFFPFSCTSTSTSSFTCRAVSWGLLGQLLFLKSEKEISPSPGGLGEVRGMIYKLSVDPSIIITVSTWAYLLGEEKTLWK